MSAPVTERARGAVRSRSAAIPAQRGIADGPVTAADPVAAPVVGRAGAPAGSRIAGRRTAQEKAYARRDDRLRRVGGARLARTSAPAGRPQFVLLIMVLLAVGLVATLWLSTAAAADSYRLQDATAEARVLSERAERLHQEVAVLASAPELARRAAELGMMPVRDPARLVVAPDGSVEVVGEPQPAVLPPPPAPPGGAPPPDPDGTGTEEGPDPAEGGAAGNGPEDDAAEESRAGENTTDGDGTAQLALPGGDAATGESTGDGTEAESAEPAGRGGGGTDAG